MPKIFKKISQNLPIINFQLRYCYFIVISINYLLAFYVACINILRPYTYLHKKQDIFQTIVYNCKNFFIYALEVFKLLIYTSNFIVINSTLLFVSDSIRMFAKSVKAHDFSVLFNINFIFSCLKLETVFFQRSVKAKLWLITYVQEKCNFLLLLSVNRMIFLTTTDVLLEMY